MTLKHDRKTSVKLGLSIVFLIGCVALPACRPVTQDPVDASLKSIDSNSLVETYKNELMATFYIDDRARIVQNQKAEDGTQGVVISLAITNKLDKATMEKMLTEFNKPMRFVIYAADTDLGAFLQANCPQNCLGISPTKSGKNTIKITDGYLMLEALFPVEGGHGLNSMIKIADNSVYALAATLANRLDVLYDPSDKEWDFDIRYLLKRSAKLLDRGAPKQVKYEIRSEKKLVNVIEEMIDKLGRKSYTRHFNPYETDPKPQVKAEPRPSESTSSESTSSEPISSQMSAEETQAALPDVTSLYEDFALPKEDEATTPSEKELSKNSVPVETTMEKPKGILGKRANLANTIWGTLWEPVDPIFPSYEDRVSKWEKQHDAYSKRRRQKQDRYSSQISKYNISSTNTSSWRTTYIREKSTEEKRVEELEKTGEWASFESYKNASAAPNKSVEKRAEVYSKVIAKLDSLEVRYHSVVFGSARLPFVYDFVSGPVGLIVKDLVKHNFSVSHGGAQGVMELAQRSALRAGGYSVGVNVGKGSQRIYGESAEEYESYNKKDFKITAYGYRDRIPSLMVKKDSILIAPGGGGTFREIAAALLHSLDPTRHMEIVFIDTDVGYYSPLYHWMISQEYVGGTSGVQLAIYRASEDGSYIMKETKTEKE